jgi:hypothetical protein
VEGGRGLQGADGNRDRPLRPRDRDRPRDAPDLLLVPRRGDPLKSEPREPVPRIEWILFGAALAVYLVTRLVGITKYPIFFFCDEALQDNLAGMLLKNKFRDLTGTFLPPYFLNDRRWAVSLSVYVHLIPVWLFGPSVACVRVTTALVSLGGVAAGGLALKQMRNRFWWSAPLIAGATPLYFVHARLGFETAMMAACYFGFLWAYFNYRTRGPRWIFAAFALGAATFYAYTAGQGVMLVIGIALLLSDLPYHFRQARSHKALFAGALLFAALMAFPYVRYRRLHPGVVQEQLAVLDSYWTHPIPLSAKLAQFGTNYRDAFDPRYWFRENGSEGARHRMDGMAFLPPVFVPFMAIGFLACVWNFPRSSLHRAVLFSPLGVPFSAAAASLQILRLMAIVVPATLLTAVGIDWIAKGLANIRIRVPRAALTGLAVVVFAALAFANVRLTREALVHGPTWSTEYGLYGMQWGAPQIFTALKEELARDRRARFFVSSTWSNNPTEFFPFFLTEKELPRVQMADIRAWDLRPAPLTGDEVFVMTPEEWQIATGPKFRVVGPVRVIPYPDGHPGFRFARIAYSAEAPALFAKEREVRAMLLEEPAKVGGETWTIRHSQNDMGTMEALFDGRLETIVRGLEANPMVFDVRFPSPRPVGGVVVSLGAMDQAKLVLQVFPESGEPVVAKTVVSNRPAKDWIELAVPNGPVKATRMRLEITDGDPGLPSHIEVRELKVK